MTTKPDVDVAIVNYWLERYPDAADPSWPTTARETVAALEADGYRIIDSETAYLALWLIGHPDGIPPADPAEDVYARITNALLAGRHG